MTGTEGARHGEAGFSLIEGMIAALILLFVILGVVPLMSQSLLNNLQGNDSTQQAQAAIDAAERFSSVPFNSEEYQVPAGSTSVDFVEVFSLESGTWMDKAAFDLLGTDTAQYTRTVTVEYFSLEDLVLDPNATELGTPLDGGIAVTNPGFFQVKRATLNVQNDRFAILGTNSGSYQVVLVNTY
jgi:type II secretory pathway pseudopilin PulG